MHRAYCPLPRCALSNDESLGTFHVGVLLSWAGGQSSWIRHLGAVWAWPNLQGCTGAMLGVADVGTGATSGRAGICCFVVAGVVSATGRGCSSCADLVGAGAVTEMQGMAGACDVIDVTAGVVSVGLTLHSRRCHLVWQ